MKLKPCPFCGSTNIKGPFGDDYSGDYYEPYWWIDCDDCPCGMEHNDEAELIEAWNKRAKLED